MTRRIDWTSPNLWGPVIVAAILLPFLAWCVVLVAQNVRADGEACHQRGGSYHWCVTPIRSAP